MKILCWLGWHNWAPELWTKNIVGDRTICYTCSRYREWDGTRWRLV